MTEERRIEFMGTSFQALGWGLVAVLASLFVIPAAWGAVALYRWFIRSLSFPGGTQASFEGRGADVWGYFSVAMLLSYAPQLYKAIYDPAASIFIIIALPILLLPISAAVCLPIIRWFFSSIKLSSGTRLNFNGNYSSYLGYTLLLSLSVYTIIGWAWASVAMLRWVCRNIESGHSELVFMGSGWGLLWRSFLATIASILIIPIPWVWLWVVRWVVRNLLINPKVQC